MNQEQIDAIVAAMPKVEYDPNETARTFSTNSEWFSKGRDRECLLLAEKDYRRVPSVEEIKVKTRGLLPFEPQAWIDIFAEVWHRWLLERE